MNRNKTDYYEIDLLRLAGALWKKLWLIVLVTLLCGALAFGYTFFLVTPLYKATAMMYVNNSAISVGSAKVSISAGDLAASQSLVDTYTVILKTRGTLNEVISRTGVPYSYQQLTKMVQAEAVNSTEVFSIDVTSPDPQEAELIANAIADILPDRIADIVEGSSVKIVDYAIVPAEIASPSYTRNTALGMLAGLVTGLFHTKCGIPAILAGILTQLSLYSVNLRIMESKANQAVSVDKYDLLVSQRYVRTFSPVGELLTKNPLPLLLLFTAAVIALLYWFFGTEKGCSIRATGANQNMARAQGIDTSANVVLGLMLSNGLVALSGALLAQYQGSSDVQMGRGAIVIGLAAVIIGEVVFGKLFINFGLRLFAVSIGAILYYIVLQAALQLGLNTNDLKLVTALIVAVFLAIPYWKGKAFHGKAQKGGAHHA